MIPRAKPNYSVIDIIKSIFIFKKKYSEKLRSKLSTILKNQNLIITNSGRGALYIILSCLPHQKVLIPAYTCKAVTDAALLAKKEIIYIETNKNGFNMNEDKLYPLMNSDCIIIATHQFGIPCNIKEIILRSKETGAFVIEDCAASLGSKIDGALTGTFGDASFFSFDSTKLINTPLKGGALLIKDNSLFAKCNLFWNLNTLKAPLNKTIKLILLGLSFILISNPIVYKIFHNIKFKWRSHYTDESIQSPLSLNSFYSSRLAEWQCYILLKQIVKLDEIMKKRRFLYKYYYNNILPIGLLLPPPDSKEEWAPIRFPIRIKNKIKFYNTMVDHGIDCAFSFSFIPSSVDFSISHEIASTILDLPFYYGLSYKEIHFICKVVNKINKD